MEHGAWGPANNEYKGTKKRLRQKNPAVQVETRDSHLCHNRLSLPSLFTPHPINHVGSGGRSGGAVERNCTFCGRLFCRSLASSSWTGRRRGRGSGGTGKEEKRCKFFLCKTATPCRVTSSAVDSVGFQRSREEIHFYSDSISCI